MPKAAIIAEFQCPACQRRFQACATASNEWRVTCPDGHPFSADPAVQRTTSGRGNRVFTQRDSESHAFGFNPADVAEARQLMGQAGNAIRDDGTVQFGDRAEQRKFSETYHKVKADNEARVDEARVSRGLSPLDR